MKTNLGSPAVSLLLLSYALTGCTACSQTLRETVYQGSRYKASFDYPGDCPLARFPASTIRTPISTSQSISESDRKTWTINLSTNASTAAIAAFYLNDLQTKDWQLNYFQISGNNDLRLTHYPSPDLIASVGNGSVILIEASKPGMQASVNIMGDEAILRIDERSLPLPSKTSGTPTKIRPVAANPARKEVPQNAYATDSGVPISDRALRVNSMTSNLIQQTINAAVFDPESPRGQVSCENQTGSFTLPPGVDLNCSGGHNIICESAKNSTLGFSNIVGLTIKQLDGGHLRIEGCQNMGSVNARNCDVTIGGGTIESLNLTNCRVTLSGCKRLSERFTNCDVHDF
jgi:hypothetical protein